MDRSRSVVGRTIRAAVRDGGQLAAVRSFHDDAERGISIHRGRVSDDAHNQDALRELSTRAAEGKLDMRVARTLGPEQAADAHRELVAAGVRGRFVIVR